MNPEDTPEAAEIAEPRAPGKGKKKRADRRRAYIAAMQAGQSQLEFFEEPGATDAPVRNPNQRVANRLLRLFFMVVLANALLFVLAAWWFYGRTHAEMERRLAEIAAQGLSAESVQRALKAAGTGQQAQEAVTALAAHVDDLKKQLGDSQHDLAEVKQKLSDSADHAAETSRLVADLAAKASASPDPAASPAVSPPAAVPLPGKEADVTPAGAELVLLKERNRLTAYADEAIATGLRGPYERLWDALEDPRLLMLVHAARAEIFRVQDCYLNGQRVKFYGIQQYQIPVAEVFPDSAALAATQLSDDQMIKLLLDAKQPWQTRVKAAWFLGQRRSTKVGDALVKAIREDTSLDVVAEATFSFEQITGYHAKLFEVKPLVAWWTAYTAEKEKPEAKTPPKPADKATTVPAKDEKTKS